ncbi:MAG: glycosyltransferase [Candidatus Competibacteraceae bacterium]|nr:glycosyltransferase [Candidatus Competibacteraceae bacterium]
MTLHPERDVCLLHNEIELHGPWLDRLLRCAYKFDETGTVTPFSNHGALCSYPRFCEDNSLAEENELLELDQLFSQVNAGQWVEIPVTVGFCWYIKRSCIERVGFFNITQFAEPDTQAIDFCLRAAEQGFKHLLCGDTLVYHQGDSGCNPANQPPPRQIMQPLRDQHPHFEQQLERYVTVDPARLLRRRVDLARLLHSTKPRLLFISHHMGGGTEKHIQDLTRLLQAQFEILILRPHENDRITLEWSRHTEEFELFFTMPADCDELTRLLQLLAITRVHFHHLIGHHPLIAQLPAKLGIPYDFSLHDYYAICPQFNLTMPDGRYCGEPDINGCNACLQQRPAPWQLDIVAWRSLFQQLLQGAQRVFGPSLDVINRVQRYVPDADFIHLPHPELKVTKVLVLGRIDPHKGGYQLEACARDAGNRGLPLWFRVLGMAAYERLPRGMMGGAASQLPLSYSGPYEEQNLTSLIAWEQPNVIYFPAQWPETYSYTLSVAMNSGCPILAPRLGAFEERLVDYPNAHFIDWNTSPDLVNDRLLQLCPVQESQPQYLEQYLSGVKAQPAVAKPWTAALLDQLLSTERVYADCPQPLEKIPMGEQSADIQETLSQQISEQQDRLELLQAWLEKKDKEIAEIYNSTSWRFSLPVRWLGWRLRRWKALFKRSPKTTL